MNNKLFGVTLETGSEVFGDGILLTVQRIEIDDNFFALVGSLDVMLGIQWLERLGNVVVNWKSQTMIYIWKSL